MDSSARNNVEAWEITEFYKLRYLWLFLGVILGSAAVSIASQSKAPMHYLSLFVLAPYIVALGKWAHGRLTDRRNERLQTLGTGQFVLVTLLFLLSVFLLWTAPDLRRDPGQSGTVQTNK